MQDDCPHPDHSSTFYRASFEQCPMADGDVLLEDSRNRRRGVDHRIILHVAAGADDDLPFVTPQNDAVPDARAIADLYIADDHCCRCDKYILTDRWAIAFIFDNHLMTTGATAFSFILS